MRSRICKQRVLCRTLAGNLVYALTVTNPSRRPADAEVYLGNSSCQICIHVAAFIEVVNGPSKTMGVANISQNL